MLHYVRHILIIATFRPTKIDILQTTCAPSYFPLFLSNYLSFLSVFFTALSSPIILSIHLLFLDVWKKKTLNAILSWTFKLSKELWSDRDLKYSWWKGCVNPLSLYLICLETNSILSNVYYVGMVFKRQDECTGHFSSYFLPTLFFSYDQSEYHGNPFGWQTEGTR